MKDFIHLFTQLDQTTKTNTKVNALVDYFNTANDSDKLWCIALLSHRRPKGVIKTAQLRNWAAEIANIPLWLFEDTYHIVGDLAETLASVHPNTEHKSDKNLTEWINFIIEIKALEEEAKKEKILWAWNQLDQSGRFAFNKLLTGGWRMGVSQKLMTKALSKSTEIEESTIAHRLMGDWKAEETTFHDLIMEQKEEDLISKPYPFYLAYALEQEPSELGEVDDWQIERKWDGIRAQLIVRKDEIFIWSRGEELVTHQFPELEVLKDILPNGTVLDGEILVYKDDEIQNFNLLQSRLGRKTVSKNQLENAPIIIKVYDCLEYNGKDIRETPLNERRTILEDIYTNYTSEVLHLSECLQAKNWEEVIEARKESRATKSEGLMIKRKDSTYQIGRKKGDWWKWKIDPLSIDAILIYAMQGHGRRANLFTDYTFAVWKGEELVPFTKAYSGLTDKEFKEIDSFVRKNTKERFGPVRSVNAELVFEIAFEGIAKSTRHKSGISLRFPRMLRWRKDKPKEEANSLEDLEKLLEQYG